MRNVRFERLELPQIEAPGDVPELEPAIFAARFARLEHARENAGLDAILIYADREHAANLMWLTGFSPRFEEALWMQVAGRTPTLLLGNENFGFAPGAVKLEARFGLYQPFSLADQPRERVVKLETLLQDAGLAREMRVGLIGWKPMSELDVPHWIVSAVQEVTGLEPTNEAHLLMDAGTGLRTVLEPQMICFIEHAARITSGSIRDLVFALKPGLREWEAAQHFNSRGLELGCHPMVNFGQTIPSGLGSPRNRRAARGGYAQMAFAVIGSLTCRAGRVIMRDDPDEDAYLGIVTNYLFVVRAWYASLRVGAAGSDVFRATESARNDAWDLALNPGHLIHLDEWVSSPFYTDSGLTLRSGAAIQQDLIPVPRAGNAVINMEDGLVLADAELRAELEQIDPELMRRCEIRRNWMERLGYELHEDVLPVSDIAGAFFPFLLEPGYIASFG